MSHNNNQPRIIPGGVPNPLQAAAAAEHQARAAQAVIAQYIQHTAAGIYSQLVAADDDRSPDALRRHAATARDSAIFLAESYGMVTINETDTAYEAEKNFED